MEAEGCSILLVSGGLRGTSTNSALLRTAQDEASAGVAGGVPAVLYGGMGNLPHFNPDGDVVPGHPAVVRRRSAIRGADALLFCTPEYAGALPDRRRTPGSLKNLLDWTVGDDHVRSIYRKPVAWVNVSASPTGAADAHESLRKVLGYVHAAVVEAACAAIPVTRQDVGEDGLIDNPSIRSHLVRVLAALVDASRL